MYSGHPELQPVGMRDIQVAGPEDDREKYRPAKRRRPEAAITPMIVGKSSASALEENNTTQDHQRNTVVASSVPIPAIAVKPDSLKISSY